MNLKSYPMKKLILIFFAIIPLLSWGQSDKKYLEPLQTIDGKINFSTQIKAPTISRQVLYDILYKWADERYKPDQKMNARIIFTDKDKGTIIVSGEEYMVFSASMLSLDRTRIYYHLQIDCSSEKVKLQISRIKYWYNEDRDGGERYKAEEWISDENALNKAKTRLLPISGKFRRKTIDLNDELVKSVQTTIGEYLLSKSGREDTTPKIIVTSDTPSEVPSVTTVVSPAVAPTQPSVEQKVVAMNADPKVNETKLSDENIIASANRITITSGNDEQFEIGKESWGGLGNLFGKDVTFCLIDTQKTMANMLLSQNDSYTISFYIKEKTEAALVIKCKKISTQTISGEEANKMNSNNSNSRKYNMYVGELVKE